MSRETSELEDRLDDMLSRIALETQEIKELEQQLTDGQILANEALQRDLEGIISGLQMYLRGLRQEARCAQQQVLSLQAENQSLQLHLEDSQRHCREQEDSARRHRQEELSVLRMETQAQRDRQVQLEAELQQLREELIRQNMLAQRQKDVKSSLQLEVHTLQRQLAQTRAHFHQTQYDGTRTLLDQSMLEPEEVQTGPEELDEDQYSPEDLPSEIQQTTTSTEQVRQDQNHSPEHIARLQAQLNYSQNHITQLEAQVGQDQDQVAQDQERDLQRLRVSLQMSHSRNKNIQQKLEAELEQSRTQLQDVQQERDGLLQQLRSQTNGHWRKLSRLNGKLRQLSRCMCDSDQRTSEQLKSTTEELRALESLVELLHTHVQQVVEETTRSFTRVKAPSLASQETQDSGLGLQYPGSPVRGRQRDRPPAGGGQRVCVPVAEWRDGNIPTGPAWLLCGAPEVVVDSPPAGGAALHCNIPEHRQVCRCVCEEAERLDEEKKKKLRLELKQLRRTLRRHRGMMQVCDEVACVEKTLLKRRAELRQADRVLLEAQSCIDSTRHKASSAQREAGVLQRTAEDGTTCLVEAFRLGSVPSGCQDSQKRLDSLISQVEQQEQRLVQRSQELQAAMSRVEEVREEERRLLGRVTELQEQQEALLRERSSVVTALRGDEQKLISVQSDLHKHRADLKQLLQELLVEQQALEGLKTKRSHSLQQLHSKQDQLDRVSDELDRTRDELHQMQEDVGGRRAELADLQHHAESHRKEAEQQRAELQQQEEDLRRGREERSSLQEQCQHLEARRRHADRCLLTVEAELIKQREELSHVQRLQQEVLRDTAATEEQRNGLAHGPCSHSDVGQVPTVEQFGAKLSSSS